ncbi:MAG: nodulation protein NfeD [Candidatus Eisenbacteria bacterium]|nr:nodulation protein NfeD [Candidatus Eisenbacteria bacterium]
MESGSTDGKREGRMQFLTNRSARAAACAILFLAGLVLLPLPGVPSEDDSLTDAASPSGRPPRVLWVPFQGVIGTVASSFLVDAIDEAEKRSADAVVIELDTPGGLDTAMRDIVKRILSSEVPVIVYVSPSGSRAASAGAFIAMAAHAVAMAPGTNIGAAHPVNIGGAQMDSTLSDKATNDAVAYLRSIAEEKGRDPEWAERAVRASESTPANEAVAIGIADCVAASRAELFEKLDGMEVRDSEGEALVLSLRDPDVEEFSMSRRYRFLAFLNDPTVAYILLLLGFYGLFFEISSPGTVFPGVVGAICLVLALFALKSFSINYTGLLLMILGVGFFVAELFTPSFGVLTAGGVAALVLGSVLLFRSPAPFLRVSLAVVLPAVAVTVAFFVFALAMAFRTRRKKPTTGRRGLVGEIGVARTEIAPKGTVFVAGAHWSAVSDRPVAAGTRIVIEKVDGLVLEVRPADQERKDG